MRGPVLGLARFYRPRKFFFTIIHWAPRKRSHGSLGYLQHTLVLLERRNTLGAQEAFSWQFGLLTAYTGTA